MEAGAEDGTLTVTDKRSGVVLSALNRFVDGGDVEEPLPVRVADDGDEQAVRRVAQHVAHRRTVGGCGRQFAAAAQAVHHGGRFALELVQEVAGPAACAGRQGGMWFRHRNAALRQMLHQVQVKRQLLETQAFEQGQDVATLIGVGEIVGVLDAARARVQGLQLPQSERMQKGSGLVKRDFGVNGHA